MKLFLKYHEHLKHLITVSRLELVARIALSVCLTVAIILALSIALKGEILFHTDIARDHLLIEDMVTRGRPTLIGPRTGGIPGVFHGPLWLYINIPMFLLSGGDPVATGWGWLLIWVLSVMLVYGCVRWLLYQNDLALATTTLYALLTFSGIVNYMNFSGASLVVPIWFAMFITYLRRCRSRYLALSYLMVGFIVQFQMALGVPLLILTSVLALVWIVRARKWTHVLSICAILPLLGTFVLFDLRHDLLQTRSTIAYLFGDVAYGKTTSPIVPFLMERFEMVRVEFAEFLSYDAVRYTDVLLLVGFLFGILCARIAYKRIRSQTASIDVLAGVCYIWIGYWFVTLPYRGVMWGYYYSPLVSIICIGLIALSVSSLRTFGILLIAVFCLLITPFKRLPSILRQPDLLSMDVGQWTYLRKMYEDTIFAPGGPEEFGYFVFTRDQLGYAPTYAMHFLAKRHGDRRVKEMQKSKVTYLLAETEPHPVANKDYWTRYQVGITSKPTQVKRLSHNFVIERYDLTESEIQTPVDPNLRQDLLFR